MLNKCFMLILIIVVNLFISCSDKIVEPDEIRPLTAIEKTIVSSSSDFGFELFKKVNIDEGQKNIFISPLSVSMALGMALNGAAGTTYEAMQSTLRLSSLSSLEINEAYKSLIDILTQIDPEIKFEIANSIWYRNDMNFEQDFININQKYFNAEVEGLNFNSPNSVAIINNWVNQNTNGKIKDILQEIPSSAIMYLINAIYFKGIWQYEFNKDNTKDDIFNLLNGDKLSCQMMAQENDKFNYFSNTDFQMIDLPYGDGHFSMTILLPKQEKTIDNVIDQLDKGNWNSWLNSFAEQKGTLQLPKFEIEYDYKLNDVLKGLGMQIAFEPSNADFTKLYKDGGVFISDVKHKTYVKIDEEGTEATAVTSIEFSRTSSSGNGGFLMRVDRPFIFVIREKQSGSILFLGKIVNPN